MIRQTKTENGLVRGIEAADPRITAFSRCSVCCTAYREESLARTFCRVRIGKE